jgi:hypothetical protein
MNRVADSICDFGGLRNIRNVIHRRWPILVQSLLTRTRDRRTVARELSEGATLSSILEIAQWLAILLLGFFLLGAYRLLGMRPSIETALDRLAGPAAGSRLPEELVAALREHDARVLAFVTEGCVGCAALLSRVERQSLERSDRTLPVLVVLRPSDALMERLSRAGVALVADTDGRYWEAAHVSATPLLVLVDDRYRVKETRVAHDYDTVWTTSDRTAD